MLSVEQFVYRRADCYKARPGSLVLPGMEAIYLFNGYCQMPDDRVLQARELVRGLVTLWAPRSPSMTPRVYVWVLQVDAFVQKSASAAGAALSRAQMDALPVPELLSRCAMGLAHKKGVPNYDSAAVVALCRGAILNRLGNADEAKQCFQWVVAKSARITKDR